MNISQKLSMLRSAMKAEGCDAFYLSCNDPHCSEFLHPHWRIVEWFSGFHGENATLVVSHSRAALWVDGRFFVQAENELAGSEIALMKMGQPDVPTVEQYLTDLLPSGSTLGFEGWCTPASVISSLSKRLSGVTLRSTVLPDELWPGRPALPASPAWLLSDKYTGQTIAQRLTDLRAKLTESEADGILLGALDEVAWLFNLRAADLDCTPYANAFAVVLPEPALLFIDSSRLLPEAKAGLEQAGVLLRDYGDILPWAERYPQKLTLLADPSSLNYALLSALERNPALTVKRGTSPIAMMKAVKNPTELASLRESHIKDGVAMVQFWMDLEACMAAHRTVTELDIDRMLHARRSAQPGFLTESFDTIAACGGNAAMMHYTATPEHYSVLPEKGFLLVDCGGQYPDGTTDITRTYRLGTLTHEEKELYTWVLQSHICMAKAVFLDYCTGFALDTFARAPLWQHLLNYRCGTGHGVAFVGAVHEGPHSLRPNNSVVFRPGMVVTDEPGVYETDWLGIRLENELVCVEKATNQYGRFLGFEPLTFVPFDLSPVLPELLTPEERGWLNDYHRMVFETLAPRLNEEEKAFLKEKTKAI